MDKLVEFAHQIISEFPHHEREIIDIVDTATNNIEDGGDEHGELEHATLSINELVKPTVIED